MEKAGRVLVRPASFDWDDVGSWTAVAKYFDQLPNGNTANCPVTSEKSGNNIVFSKDKLQVALLGVSDLIVVQTEDAILVCNRHEVENVKNLVESLPDKRLDACDYPGSDNSEESNGNRARSSPKYEWHVRPVRG
jgi:mannose-1-phosphate guanylyltransferase